jgi:hypothetical protein
MRCHVLTASSWAAAALALFWGQLEARAFQEEYDAASFEDLSMPRYDSMHKVRGIRHACDDDGATARVTRSVRGA